MTGRVNYIKHLQAVVARFEQDDRLSPWHISLYHALFHCWNDNKFNNPVSINRNEVMSLSKIGSVNTYTKALKELSEWEYIVYEPSYNRWVGSKIYMYRFDKGTDKASDNTTEQRTDNGSSKSSEQEPIKEVRPSIKVIKKNKGLKVLKERKSKTSFAIPSIEEVKEFFLQSDSNVKEAENFHNYFESNGWLVGGKAKMKNWKAAARNWISRSSNFRKPEKKNYLDVDQDKDYSIPL